MDLQFLERVPREVSSLTPTVFLLHGRKSVARTIFSIEGLLDPRFHVFALQAPFRSDLNGVEGYEWFVPKPKEEDEVGEENVLGVLARREHEMATSERLLTSKIFSLLRERALDPKLVFLIGFSQGAAMTFLLSLRGVFEVRGAVPMSGFLPSEIREWPKLSTSTHFVVPHGDKDDVLEATSSIRANEFLREHGIDSEFKLYKGRHKMSLDIVRYVSSWIVGLSGI